MADGDAAPPSPARVLAVVPVALSIAIVARWADPWPRVSWETFLAFAAGGAGLVGVPATVWLLETGRSAGRAWVAAGTAAGLVPLGLALTSGLIGRYVWGGTVAYVLEYAGRRAPLPLAGAVPWPTFRLMAVECLVVGACSGAVYWLLFVRGASARVRPHREASP